MAQCGTCGWLGCGCERTTRSVLLAAQVSVSTVRHLLVDTVCPINSPAICSGLSPASATRAGTQQVASQS